MTPEQRHAQLRGPENPRARGHSPAIEQREAAAARAAGEPPAGDDPQAPPANSAEKLKVGKYEVSEAELASMMDRQAQDDLKKATLPASPEAYEAKLPADLKLPGGLEYRFDLTDPSLIAARNLAHAKGWSQQDFSEALGIFASHIASQEAALAERSAAEVAKAGVNAPQRVDAVGKWITAEVGEADAKPIRATIVTDAHLRFYERLMQKVSSQGTASFSQSHRAPPEVNSIPGYENMSFEQRRHAQQCRNRDLRSPLHVRSNGSRHHPRRQSRQIAKWADLQSYARHAEWPITERQTTMSLFVLTVNNLTTALERQHQEAQLVARALDLAKQDFRSNGGKRVSANIIDAGGAVLGTWTYVPQATS